MKNKLIQFFGYIMVITMFIGCKFTPDVVQESRGIDSTASSMIVAKLLSISSNEYNDLAVMKRRYKHASKGFTKLFIQLQILRIISTSQQDPKANPAQHVFKVGQILDAYAYKEMDVIDNIDLGRGVVFRSEIVAEPAGDTGFYYKLNRIGRNRK